MSIMPAEFHNSGGQVAKCDLDIVVVGGGIGGLSVAYSLARSGHNVTIIDTKDRPGELGAGIQISPNASRLLIRWGLEDELTKSVVEPHGVAIRRYNNDVLIGYSLWGEVMRKAHKAPYYHVHRADLHDMLLGLVQRTSNVRTVFGSFVIGVDPIPSPKVTVQLSTGEMVACDLVVGADGLNSVIRNVVLGMEKNLRPSGDVAYRAIVPTELMEMDPELNALINTPEVTAWIGPSRHVIGYCISAQREYNIVAVHCEGNTKTSPRTAVPDLLAIFNDFHDRVKKLLSLGEEPLKWTLVDMDPLERWVHPAGRAVLLGDACHPMLPYRAQGAAMAIEDAAVMGSLLSRLSSRSQLPAFLSAYEEIRRPRTTKAQLNSRSNQYVFHLPDGPFQEKRDAEMQRAMLADFELVRYNAGYTKPQTHDEGNPNKWADMRENVEQFSYDADSAAESWLSDHGAELIHDTANKLQGS